MNDDSHDVDTGVLILLFAVVDLFVITFSIFQYRELLVELYILPLLSTTVLSLILLVIKGYID